MTNSHKEQLVSDSKIPPGRFTVAETLYFENDEHGQQSFGEPFSGFVMSDERAYERPMKCGEEWQRLDTGWAERPRMLLIRNLEGKFLRVNPTDEERADVAKRVLWIGFRAMPDNSGSVALMFIRPGESARFEPTMPLDVRSAHGQCKFSVVAIPE